MSQKCMAVTLTILEKQRQKANCGEFYPPPNPLAEISFKWPSTSLKVVRDHIVFTWRIYDLVLELQYILHTISALCCTVSNIQRVICGKSRTFIQLAHITAQISVGFRPIVLFRQVYWQPYRCEAGDLSWYRVATWALTVSLERVSSDHLVECSEDQE